MFQKEKLTQAKAEVKDGALVLYLPKALKPCVWRMGLDLLSETSIEIDEKDHIHILATRDINGIIKSIAGFQNKEDAQEALSLTLNALMNNGSSNGSSAFFGAIPFGKIIKWSVFTLIVLWLGLTLLKAPVPAPVENASAISEKPSVIDETGHLKVGVPVDVDSLFKQTDE